MTHEWQQLQTDMAAWVAPDDLEQWAGFVTTDDFDVRAELLELANRYDRGSRFGRALTLLLGFRNAQGIPHRVTNNIVLGTVRYLCEVGGNDQTEEQVEQAFRRHHLTTPFGNDMDVWLHDTTLQPAAYARSTEELIAIAGSFDAPTDPDPTVAEAGEWLRASTNANAFAPNRFTRTAEAIAFVDELYAAGAVRVTIENIVDPTPSACSDSMVVELPADPSQRVEVLRIINDVGRPERDNGGITDSGEPTVGLWWD